MIEEGVPGAAAAPGALPDAVPGSRLLAAAPASWLPYIQLARLDRPIGWWLLLLPCWWSSALASLAAHRPPHGVQLGLFLVGAIAMRGAGSTYNDIVDRELDAKVARTRGRPLPSGRITLGRARAFLVAQALVGLAVVVCFDLVTIALGLASLLIVATYPFAKRVTSWPQLVLGLAFAWGGLLGWTAATGTLAAAPVLVYVAAVCWTIGYDTIYAVQDMRDDPAAGIRSTARLFAGHLRLAVGAFYAAAVVAMAGALVLAGAGRNAVALGGLAGFALHCAGQVRRLDADDAAGALALFRANRDAGLVLFAGLALGTFVPH